MSDSNSDKEFKDAEDVLGEESGVEVSNVNGGENKKDEGKKSKNAKKKNQKKKKKEAQEAKRTQGGDGEGREGGEDNDVTDAKNGKDNVTEVKEDNATDIKEDNVTDIKEDNVTDIKEDNVTDITETKDHDTYVKDSNNIINTSPDHDTETLTSIAKSEKDVPESVYEDVQPPSTNKSSVADITSTYDDEPNNISVPSRDLIKDSITVNEPIQPSFNHVNKQSPNYLLESKFNQIKTKFDAKDHKNQQIINSGIESVKSFFNQIKSTTELMQNVNETKDIPWDLWTQVIEDYESMVINKPTQLNDLIMLGIPQEIRGIVWQIIGRSKNLDLEEFYLSIKNEVSTHEKQIKRDITRTSFYNSISRYDKINDLYNVIKGYSLFDPDVGYTQGMIFITTPLILVLNEAECFSILVSLMKDYNLRDLFSPDMLGLHLMLYKFDRLLEIYSPSLFNYLSKQGIKSSMYASQWFLTIFGYKFPIEIVLRIYDILITQGLDSLLKFAINLMLKNEMNLMCLRFDDLLNFLKHNLFNIYVNEKYVTTDPSSKQLQQQQQLLDYYNLDEFVKDSMEINFNPNDLDKFDLEFHNILQTDIDKKEEIDQINLENGKLRNEIKHLQMKLTSLNGDHLDVIEKLVKLKVKLPELKHDSQELEEETHQLKSSIELLNANINDEIPEDIENEINRLLVINKEETEKNIQWEDELNELQSQDQDLSEKLKSKKKWFWK